MGFHESNWSECHHEGRFESPAIMAFAITYESELVVSFFLS